MNDGVLIEIADGAKIARPIHIVNCHVGSVPSSTYARSLIVAGKNSEATIVESFVGPDGIAYQTNSAAELHVGDNASFDFIRLQAEGKASLHLSTLLANIGNDAKVSLYPLTSGAAVSRYSVTLRFAGNSIEGRFAGANLLRGRQHADTTLVLDHAMPNGTSRELIKSALDDESRGIFQGRIIVRRGAQKTDARMATHALMLSDTAESDNKPELEIFADDVQCGHGATSGAIDESLMFYFLARGIPRKEAEALLIQSFVAEPLEMIAHERPSRGVARARRRLAEGAKVTTHPAVTNGAYDVARLRADFPALSLKIYDNKPLVYLDNAASAQKPKAVLDRMRTAYESEYSNVHRGLHYLANAATEGYEGARESVRKFLNAKSTNEIVFVKNATEAINLVAASFGLKHIAEGRRDRALDHGASFQHRAVAFSSRAQGRRAEMGAGGRRRKFRSW